MTKIFIKISEIKVVIDKVSKNFNHKIIFKSQEFFLFIDKPI